MSAEGRALFSRRCKTTFLCAALLPTSICRLLILPQYMHFHKEEPSFLCGGKIIYSIILTRRLFWPPCETRSGVGRASQTRYRVRTVCSCSMKVHLYTCSVYVQGCLRQSESFSVGFLKQHFFMPHSFPRRYVVLCPRVNICQSHSISLRLGVPLKLVSSRNSVRLRKTKN